MKLRVTTHVMTDADFRAALNAGVDEMRTPCFWANRCNHRMPRRLRDAA